MIPVRCQQSIADAVHVARWEVDCHIQRRLVLVVAVENIGPLLDGELLDGLNITKDARTNGQIERSFTTIVGILQTGTVFQKNSNESHVALAGCNVERRHIIAIEVVAACGVDISTLLEEQRDKIMIVVIVDRMTGSVQTRLGAFTSRKVEIPASITVLSKRYRTISL